MSTSDIKIRRPRRSILAAVLLSLLLCIVLVVVVSVISPMWLNTAPISQVRANASMYDEVVRMIESGAISSGSISGEIVALPPAYHELSPAKNDDALSFFYRSGFRLLGRVELCIELRPSAPGAWKPGLEFLGCSFDY